MTKKLLYLFLITFALSVFVPAAEAAVVTKPALVKTSKKHKRHGHKKKHRKGKAKRHHKA